MPRSPLLCALAFALASVFMPPLAAAQQSGAVPAESEAPRASDSSTGEVAPGVYRTSREGTLPVLFQLRGRGSEPIGVGSAFIEGGVVQFTPACATPCTLWFEPGPYLVELGRSPLRTRVFPLTVGTHSLAVSFTRDSFAGIASGVALAGLGFVTTLLGGALALTESSGHALWWGLAGGGAALLTGGVLLAYFSFGTSEARALEAAPDSVASRSPRL